VCDSLGINVGVQETVVQANTSAYPNPNSGEFVLSYPAQASAGVLELYNAAGQVVLREKLPAWSTMHNVQLSNMPAGMYHCRLQWGSKATSVRVILDP